MFEAAQKQSMGRLWVAFAVFVAVAGIGSLLYTMSKKTRTAPVAAVVPAAAPVGQADPVHDLKILSARMEKDPTGTIAMWLVDIDNKSKSYTYSSIQYETTYVGPNNAAVAVNKGTIAISLAPGDERNTEIRDVLYPAGTAWYKFRIIGATSKVQ
jgi:hypothetical protein